MADHSFVDHLRHYGQELLARMSVARDEAHSKTRTFGEYFIDNLVKVKDVGGIVIVLSQHTCL